MRKLRTCSAVAALTLVITGSPLLLPLKVNEARAGMLAPIWTGAYVGFHGGAKWADIDTNFSSTVSATNATGGGHAGFNLGLGGVIVGIEGDANLDSSSFGFSTSGGGTGSFETDWSGTVRGRVGVPVGPAFLYATAGYAWNATTINAKNASGASFSSNHTFGGVVYGIGAETYVLPNLSLRLEALRYEYGADKLSLTGVSKLVDEIDPSDTVVRAGITFHLN